MVPFLGGMVGHARSSSGKTEPLYPVKSPEERTREVELHRVALRKAEAEACVAECEADAAKAKAEGIIEAAAAKAAAEVEAAAQRTKAEAARARKAKAEADMAVLDAAAHKSAG